MATPAVCARAVQFMRPGTLIHQNNLGEGRKGKCWFCQWWRRNTHWKFSLSSGAQARIQCCHRSFAHLQPLLGRLMGAGRICVWMQPSCRTCSCPAALAPLPAADMWDPGRGRLGRSTLAFSHSPGSAFCGQETLSLTHFIVLQQFCEVCRSCSLLKQFIRQEAAPWFPSLWWKDGDCLPQVIFIEIGRVRSRKNSIGDCYSLILHIR